MGFQLPYQLQLVCDRRISEPSNGDVNLPKLDSTLKDQDPHNKKTYWKNDEFGWMGTMGFLGTQKQV